MMAFVVTIRAMECMILSIIFYGLLVVMYGPWHILAQGPCALSRLIRPGPALKVAGPQHKLEKHWVKVQISGQRRADRQMPMLIN